MTLSQDPKQLKNGEAEPFDLIFFAELQGRRICAGSVKKKVGNVSDLVFKVAEPFPVAAGILVTHGWGKPNEFIPWEKVVKVDDDALFVQPVEGVYPPLVKEAGQILVDEDLIGKTIFDMDDRRVEVVNDIHLLSSRGKMLLVHVDTSFNGFLRKWGLGKLTWIKDQLISWKYVQPLSVEEATTTDAVKLSVARKQIRDLPGEDLADALEELSGQEQTAVFSSLDSEKAAEALVHAEPRAQRQLIANLRKERARTILTEMSVPQLAGLFSVLPHDQVTTLMELLPKEDAARIRGITSQEESTARAAMSSEYLAVDGGILVGDLLAEIRASHRAHESISYIYIVGPDKQLKGVVDLRDLVLAGNESTLEALMSSPVVSIQEDDPLDDLAELFAKYHYRMIPVVDAEDKLLGVIHYNDIMKGLVTRPIV
jgi:CBS domain-containing protein/sporulation protein YlmC with PRC-barrel domain